MNRRKFITTLLQASIVAPAIVLTPQKKSPIHVVTDSLALHNKEIFGDVVISAQDVFLNGNDVHGHVMIEQHNDDRAFVTNNRINGGFEKKKCQLCEHQTMYTKIGSTHDNIII